MDHGDVSVKVPSDDTTVTVTVDLDLQKFRVDFWDEEEAIYDSITHRGGRGSTRGFGFPTTEGDEVKLLERWPDLEV